MRIKAITKLIFLLFTVLGLTYCKTDQPKVKQKNITLEKNLKKENPGKKNLLILGSAFNMPLSNPQKQNGILDLIYKEAFSRIGLDVLVESLPAQRSIINANKGIIDGDISRIEGLGRLFPNLIEVPENVGNYNFVAITKLKDIEIKTWEDLKPYTIALVTGWKILEEKTAGFPNVQSVKNAKILFTLLKKNRIDIILYDQIQGIGLIQKMGFKEFRIITPPLLVIRRHLFLHKKHKDIVPKINKALEDMKRDGTFKKIVNEVLKNYPNIKINY